MKLARSSLLISAFAIAAAIAACSDAGDTNSSGYYGSSAGGSGTTAGVCDALATCCGEIDDKSTRATCQSVADGYNQAAAQAGADPAQYKQACDAAADQYKQAKLCGPNKVKGGAGAAGASGGQQAGSGGSSGSSSTAGGSGGTTSQGGSGGGTFGQGGASGSSSGGENTIEACSDGQDNDGNGFIDCNDKGCCSVIDCSSDPTSYCGKKGMGGSGGTGGSSGGSENTTALCTDGKDNDGDSYIDCNDSGCCAVVDCSADLTSYCGKKGSGGSGGSGGSTGGSENTVALCTDGKDNDGDGYIDCDDGNCCSVVDCSSQPTSYCGKKGMGGSGGTGGSSGSENTVALCTDGKDNDGDSYIDCNDSGCCAVVDCSADLTSYCGKKGSGGSAGSGGSNPACAAVNGTTGCCIDTMTVTYCTGAGAVQQKTCTAGTTCGYDETKKFFTCTATPGTPPAGTSSTCPGG